MIGLSLVAQLSPLVPTGSLTEELRSPAGVAVAADGTVLVTDTFHDHIARYNAVGTLQGTWAVPEGPVGVAVHPSNGNYYVSLRDEGKVGIYVYDDVAETFTRTGFLGDGIPEVTFVGPTDIDIASDTGRILVVDPEDDKWYLFNSDGTLRSSGGVRGEANGQFKHPSAISYDETNGRMIIADHDNFRVQIFSLTDDPVDPLVTYASFDSKFGYRMKYLSIDEMEGWMPRPLGVEVDADGYIYLTDALMGTVRIFDPTGKDLGKVVDYGHDAGDLRTPCGLALSPDGLLLYVVSTNSSTVEIYNTPTLGGVAGRIVTDGRRFDPPGTNTSLYDDERLGQRERVLQRLTNKSGKSGRARLGRTSSADDASTPALVIDPGYDGPHMVDGRVICGRCHGISDQPGGHEGQIEGQVNLCISCHTGGGQAMDTPVHELDMAGGSDGRGRSHAWGVPAINEAVGSAGPPPGSELERRLDGGDIKCATCHNPHNNDAGPPYMRINNDNGAMCKECHVNHIGHTPSGDWQPTCAECHDMHSSTSENLALMATSVENQTLALEKPVVFTARSGSNSFNDGDPAANDGICQVCHTATSYHLHDGAGTPHNDGTTCTRCHPHAAGFMPAGGDCTACHSLAQDNGDNVPPGGRRAVVPFGGNPNDFGNTSHHVRGDVQGSDCVVCHEMIEHQQGHVRLLDPDDAGTVYVHDQATAEELETFCINCHDSDGAAAGLGTTPFSDGATVPNVKGVPGSMWADSAHNLTGQRCNTCHGSNAHGSDNIRLLQAALVDTLCYNCHTEGVLTNNAISGPGLSDDIEEAFSFGSSSKHDIRSSFTIGADTFSLQCTSCHNPHVVTGKYWDADSGVTPITRPDFSDPVHNPRVMGTDPWGDGSGEKMDDYAGGGTYRAPTGDSFSGSQLPDYNTFCDDCHEPMPDPIAQGGAHGQLHFNGNPHSRISANVPDGGALCPNWYTCGKGVKWDGDNCTPDDGGGLDAECWPVIPRGRGEQIWSKSPYSQEERITGPNFVLSCTDCHEAHGSSVQSMIRTNPNSGTGSTNWLTMCLNCHYFYSEFHAGMNCGNASCHGANAENERMTMTGTDTLHRMGQRYGDSSTRTFNPDLVLDMRFENNLKGSASFRLDGAWSLNRPDSSQHGWCAADPAGTGSFVTGTFGNAIEISNQPVEVGTEDCDWSTLENAYSDTREDNGLGHRHGGHGTWKYTEMKYNMTLEAWVYPTDDTNERKIMAKHTYGGGGYAFVLKQFDGSLRVGLLANINGGSGTGDCGGLRGAYSAVSIPLNKWTHVAATYDAAGSDRDPGDGAVGRIRICVDGEDVTTSLPDIASCYAQPGPGEGAMYPNSEHNDGDPGSWWASALSVGGINWSDPNVNFVGRLDEVKVWNITQDPSYFDAQIRPLIAGVRLAGAATIVVTFNEGVWHAGGANLDSSDFVLDCSGKSVTTVDHIAGQGTTTLTLDNPVDPSEVSSCAISLTSDSVRDEYLLFALGNVWEPVSAVPGHFPSLLSVEGVVDEDKLKVTSESQVYTDMGEAGALQAGDFILNAGGKTILAVQHVAGSSVAILSLDGVLSPGDVGTATVGAAGVSIFGPGPAYFPAATDPVTVSAQAAPAISRVEGATGYDEVFLAFSEGVYSGTGQSGALVPSDFTDTDSGWSIIGVAHVAGASSAILTLDSTLDPGDIGTESIAAASNEVFNSIDNPAGNTPVIMTGNDCPVWGTSLPIEDEPQYSATISDAYGLLTGTVGNPTFVFPDVDNDWFNGDDEQATYIEFLSNNACLNSPRALTIEARVRPTEVDKGVGVNTFNRVFERRRTILVTILNTDYRGDDIPERADKASIEIKYRVDAASRHNCPHPQWPDDPKVQTDVRMHQISSDIDQWPLVNNHWYQIKVVLNSDKTDVPGSNGTPVDIFIDDQGVDGLNSPNPTPGDPSQNPEYEQWAGYVNATKTINESSSCRWGALPGDYIELRDDSSHIGASWGHAQLFEGLIDWVSWKPVADYSGVDDAPR